MSIAERDKRSKYRIFGENTETKQYFVLVYHSQSIYGFLYYKKRKTNE